MAHYTNSKGCEINAIIWRTSEFYSYFAENGNRAIEFGETISHKLIDIEFSRGRTVYVQICGYRKRQIPQRVKTAKQLAEWVNKMDF